MLMEICGWYEYVEPDALQRLLEDDINRLLANQKVNIRFSILIGRLDNVWAFNQTEENVTCKSFSMLGGTPFVPGREPDDAVCSPGYCWQLILEQKELSGFLGITGAYHVSSASSRGLHPQDRVRVYGRQSSKGTPVLPDVPWQGYLSSHRQSPEPANRLLQTL